MFKHPTTSYSSGMISMLFLLSVLLVCCRGGTFAAADVEPGNSNEVVLFKEGKTQLSPVEGSSRTGLPNSFYGHSLLDVNGMMVALAMADFTNVGADNSGENKRDIWAKYTKYGGDEGTISEITKEENEGEWKTQVVVKKGSDKDQYDILFGPRAVAKGNKIHILLTNMTRKIPAAREKAADILLDLEWVVGDVTSATGGGQEGITWKPPTSLKESLTAHMTTNKWTNLLSAAGGRGVVAGGSTIVFPLQAVTTADYLTEESANKGCICSAIYTENDGKTWSLPSKPVIAEGCKHSTLLEWEGKLLMVTVSFLGARNVYESTDNGRTWNKATGPIAHLLSDSDTGPRISNANDLITATIANRNVILFTQVSSGDTDEGLGSAINIWLSDGTRMHNAGPISTGTMQRFYAFSALLHTNNELFALYERKEGDASSGSVVLTHLTEHLKRITSVLKTWKEVDERVSTSCTSATKKDACTTPLMPTTGLIGFLSNTGNGTNWADEYLGVNAIVGGDDGAPAAAKKVENGFTLSGSAGRIEWPVGEQRSQQAYSFVNDGLTLVATVSINKAPATVTPLVGVLVQPVNGKPRSSERYLGLWYDENKRWRTEVRNPVTAETINWEEGQTYQVALTIQSGTGSAYVDGKRVGSLEENTPDKDTHQEGESSEHDKKKELEEELGRQPPRNKILYVFFWDLNKKGNEEDREIQVTVKNVFLYNHAFNNSEMEALIPMDEKSTVQTSQHPQTPQDPPDPRDPRDPQDPQDPQDPRDRRDPRDPREPLPSSLTATKTTTVAAADTSLHGSVPRMSPLVLGLCVFVLLGWVV